LTFINNTANPSYPFCSIPSSESLNVDMVVQYKNTTSYPQRTYDPAVQVLTNTTTNKTLYLLNTVDGIYVTFQVLTGGNTPISGTLVNATRVIGSEDVIVGDGTTGAGGSVTFWLNPDFLHTMSFLKTGYDLYTTSLTPTQSIYTIVMGVGATTTAVDYNRGISITTLPTGSFINSDTTYSFNYTISTSYHLLDNFGMNLTYKNGTIINSQSSTTDVGGTLNHNFNTENSTKIIMNYYYTINSTQINGTTTWLVSASNSFSLWHFFTDLILYIDADIFGIQSDDNGYFAKALLSVVIIIMVSGGLSLRYGIQSEQAISGIIFSILLLLNILNFIPTPDSFLLRDVNIGNLLVAIMAMVTIAFVFKEEQR